MSAGDRAQKPRAPAPWNARLAPENLSKNPASKPHARRGVACATSDAVAQIYKERVIKRGYGSGSWGWLTAYHEGIAV